MSEKGTSLARFVEHFGLEILNKGDTYDTDRIESTISTGRICRFSGCLIILMPAAFRSWARQS